MLYIDKGEEPASLRAYRKTPGACYPLPGGVHGAVVSSLCKEQGHLCAYCMRRIAVGDGRRSESAECTIEHYAPRNPHGGEGGAGDLDYENMLGVCRGDVAHRPPYGSQTCDKKKGNAVLTLNPQNRKSMRCIRYGKGGKIFSDEIGAQHDLDDILNLNHPLLVEYRRDAIRELQKALKKELGPTGAWSKRALERKRRQLETAERKVPYTGILIWYLESKM